MNSLFHGLFLAAICLIVVVLTVTALPSIQGETLGGIILMLHMMASGALVFALPVYAMLYVWRHLDRSAATATQRLGFWCVLVTGLIATATMFACMMPIASTETMHHLVQWHGYAGFAMVPAVVLLLWGVSRTRSLKAERMKSTRSATPG